jgi:iron-sulfur cluster protein
MSDTSIKGDIRAALSNENLRGALGRFADDYLESRQAAYRNKDFNDLRDKIAEIKSRAAGRMEELAERFAAEAARRGAKVFRAETAGQARDYILNLARERGVKTIVKSKSMASEEIHLNRYLAEAGMEVVETDLGEWIIQLCGQRPSHMVLPAIHMTRGQVAGIFSRETGEELPPEISRLVKVARENLRQKFLKAELGISGANIAVAETGTLVMVTNEGNGRLTTTLPPLHVAVVGLEKLVERFIDAVPILEALPRSATSQQLTSYVTMLTGPAPAVDASGSPVQKEMHIVLLNNGRTEMQSDPVFKEALQCIRCASCLNVCPVFQLVGGHVFGYVYTGSIGSVLTAFFNGLENAAEIQSLCLGCQRCKDFCPAKINLPRLINDLRTRIAQQSGLSLPQRLFLKKVLTNRSLFHGLLRAAAVGQKPFVKEGTVRHRVFQGESPVGEFVPGKPDPQGQLLPHHVPDRRGNLQHKAEPVIQAAAVLVQPVVGKGGKKLAQDGGVGSLQLQSVKPAFPDMNRCQGVAGHQPGDIEPVHFFGHFPEEGIPDRGGRPQGQPGVDAGALVAVVVELGEYFRPVLVNHPRNQAVTRDDILPVGLNKLFIGAVRGMDGLLFGDDQARTPPGPFPVIISKSLARQAVLRQVCQMSRKYNPVVQTDRPYLNVLKQIPVSSGHANTPSDLQAGDAALPDGRPQAPGGHTIARSPHLHTGPLQVFVKAAAGGGRDHGHQRVKAF